MQFIFHICKEKNALPVAFRPWPFWISVLLCVLFVGQSNLTNGFLNKYGSLICNQKDRRGGGGRGSRRKPRKCMPKAGQFKWQEFSEPWLLESADRYKRQPQGQDQRFCAPGRVSSVGVPVTESCVCVCECSDMPAYSHFKMASIFLSQQNGDCKIVVLAQLQRSVKKLLCVWDGMYGRVMRCTVRKEY